MSWPYYFCLLTSWRESLMPIHRWLVFYAVTMYPTSSHFVVFRYLNYALAILLHRLLSLTLELLSLSTCGRPHKNSMMMKRDSKSSTLRQIAQSAKIRATTTFFSAECVLRTPAVLRNLKKLLLFLSVGLSSFHLWMTCCKKQTSNSASQPITISVWTCMAGSSILNTFKRFLPLILILCLSSPDDCGPVPASSFWFCRSVFILRCFTALIIMQPIVQSELPSVIGETSSQAKSLLLSVILLFLHRQWYNLYKRFSILLEMTDLLDLVADTDFHNAAAPKKPFLHLKSVRA